ncbi:MAG: glycoside hydrolase family 10 protein, partial [Xenococcaceae cyanobacterium]
MTNHNWKQDFFVQYLRRSLKYFLPLLFLLSFNVILLTQSFIPAQAQLPRQEIRGVWMTNNDL